MKKVKSKSVLIIEDFNLASWKNKIENIYLNVKGEIFCDSFIIKDYTKGRNYKRMYFFTKEYLDKKRKRYDVTDIFRITIEELRLMMWSKNMKSISRKRVEEMVHWENQIGNIKGEIIKRVKRYIENQIYKTRQKEIARSRK